MKESLKKTKMKKRLKLSDNWKRNSTWKFLNLWHKSKISIHRKIKLHKKMKEKPLTLINFSQECRIYKRNFFKTRNTNRLNWNAFLEKLKNFKMKSKHSEINLHKYMPRTVDFNLNWKKIVKTSIKKLLRSWQNSKLSM